MLDKYLEIGNWTSSSDYMYFWFWMVLPKKAHPFTLCACAPAPTCSGRQRVSPRAPSANAMVTYCISLAILLYTKWNQVSFINMFIFLCSNSLLKLTLKAFNARRGGDTKWPQSLSCTLETILPTGGLSFDLLGLFLILNHVEVWCWRYLVYGHQNNLYEFSECKYK